MATDHTDHTDQHTSHTSTTDADTGETVPPIAWVGVNHLALITSDMDATVRFWHGVLGADLVATVGVDTFRHYFFRVGETTTVAFFEYTDAAGAPLATDTVSKPAGEYHPKAGQFDHLSLDVPDHAALIALQERLRAFGCEVTEVVDHRFIHSIYFTDPNGIALEASYWVGLTDKRHPDYADAELFGDPDPVPALRELIAGRLASTPATHLAASVPSR